MRVPGAKLLRNHWHALLIVPLVVIAMTWPAFTRIFDQDEFWLHTTRADDAWLKFWDAWHVERVLAGQSDYFFTDAMFHPPGISLAFRAQSTPHSLIMFAVKQALPADDAYSLVYLLMLGFNAFCAYLLVHHLLKDRWIALFGAVVAGVHVWFIDVHTAPDILMMGTLPLTVYLLDKAITAGRDSLAAMAGFCAGVTAFIGLYTFLILLMTVGIYALCLAVSFWRQSRFWKKILLLLGICAAISTFRVYPIIADAAVLEEGLGRYPRWQPGKDVLDYLLLSRNPVTGDFLRSLFNAAPDATYRFAYLGYINIFFCVIGILYRPIRRRLLPWLALFAVFAILRQGDHLLVNGQAHVNIVLPEHFLGNLFPTTLGQIGESNYYITGLITPLAVLPCFGLSVILRSTRVKLRAAVSLLSVLTVAVEYYLPREAFVLEREKTAYIDWLSTENESPIKIIDLPQGRSLMFYYQYTQSLSGYVTAYGEAHRNRHAARNYSNSNYLLRAWRNHQPAVCLPLQNSSEYIAALNVLLQDGFSHIVLHNWRPYDADLQPSFAKVQPAYDDGYVSVYRLADMRRNCDPPPLPPAFDRFARSPWVLPGDGSYIFSYHPSKNIDPDTLAYLGLLFSDWESFHHLYQHDGEWMKQSATQSDAHGDDAARNRRIVHLIYNNSDGPPRLPENIEFRDEFNLCRREAYEDGAVIELYFNPRFSCALVDSDSSLRVEYDNGAQIENMLYDFTRDVFDLQILWRNLPADTHSVSVQLFDGAGDKVHGQDSVVGSRSITRHIVDLSALPPGDYVFKLIFYRYSTGKSVPGAVSSSGARFDRALEFATIRKS